MKWVIFILHVAVIKPVRTESSGLLNPLQMSDQPAIQRLQ